MKFGAAEVRHLGALARLAIDDDRAEQFAGELSRVLGYVEQLRALEGASLPDDRALSRREDRPHSADPVPLLRECAGVQIPTVVGGEE